MFIRFPVAIEPGTKTTCFGVAFPDFPGCVSAGNTIPRAMAAAERALLQHIEELLQDGLPIPAPSMMVDVQENPQFAGWTFGLIPVDASLLASKAKEGLPS